MSHHQNGTFKNSDFLKRDYLKASKTMASYCRYLIILSMILFVSCNILSEPIVKKCESYLITQDNESFVFIVVNIRHERNKGSLFESIKYKLYEKGANCGDELTSSVNYRRTQKGDHSYLLEKLEGSTEISKGAISFTWSYSNSDTIYVYLDEVTKIEKMT